MPGREAKVPLTALPDGCKLAASMLLEQECPRCGKVCTEANEPWQYECIPCRLLFRFTKAGGFEGAVHSPDPGWEQEDWIKKFGEL